MFSFRWLAKEMNLKPLAIQGRRSLMNIGDSGYKVDAPLMLPDDEVHLWRVDLDAIRSEEFHWLKVLSEDEAKRAARFHFPVDRERFIASRAFLRKILAGYLDAAASDLTFTYSKKEKPSLGPAFSNRGLTFNLSHSGGIALCAFSRCRDVGVDVEQIRRDFEVEGIARRFFSPHEQDELAQLPAAERVEAFFRCWTRKEAYIKATGDGLSLPLTQFDVSLTPGCTNALLSTRPDDAETSLWKLIEVPAGSGYIAALCVRGRDWKLKDWSANPGNRGDSPVTFPVSPN
jgi:4'-phosphopantetheinyl transferase